MTFTTFMFMMIAVVFHAFLKSLIGYFTIVMMIKTIQHGWRYAVRWLFAVPGMVWTFVLNRVQRTRPHHKPQWLSS